jgi:hypothetical protein
MEFGWSGLHSSRTLTFTGTGAFSGNTSNSHGALSIYSMIEGVTIAFNGPGTASFDYSADSTLVPEPSSLTLAVLRVLGLVGNGLRRHKALGA